MKVSDYIRTIIEATENSADVIGITFDLGVDTDMTVNEKSLNRVKFSIRRRNDGRK